MLSIYYERQSYNFQKSRLTQIYKNTEGCYPIMDEQNVSYSIDRFATIRSMTFGIHNIIEAAERISVPGVRFELLCVCYQLRNAFRDSVLADAREILEEYGL